jgi:hypothetical protein
MYIAVHEDRKTILVQIYLHSCPRDEKKMSNDPISICMLKMMEEYQKNNILYFNIMNCCLDKSFYNKNENNSFRYLLNNMD